MFYQVFYDFQKYKNNFYKFFGAPSSSETTYYFVYSVFFVIKIVLKSKIY